MTAFNDYLDPYLEDFDDDDFDEDEEDGALEDDAEEFGYETDAYLEHEPEEEDLVTADHISFFSHGGGPDPVLVVAEGEDYKTALKEYMANENFYPAAWFISDHGNAHLIDLG